MANVDDLNQFTHDMKKLMKKNTVVAIRSFSLAGIIKEF